MNFEMWSLTPALRPSFFVFEQGFDESEIDEALRSIRLSEYEARVASTDFDRALLHAVVRSPEFLRLRAAWGTTSFPEIKLENFVSGVLSEFRSGLAFPYRGALTVSLLLAEHAESESLKAFLREMAHNYGIEFGACVRIARRCLRRIKSQPVIIQRPIKKFETPSPKIRHFIERYVRQVQNKKSNSVRTYHSGGEELKTLHTN